MALWPSFYSVDGRSIESEGPPAGLLVVLGLLLAFFLSHSGS